MEHGRLAACGRDGLRIEDAAPHVRVRGGRGVQSCLPLGTPVDEPGSVAELLDRIAAWAPYRALATHHLWEDLFWRHACEPVAWLAPAIRL